jgi:hypothetical protein
LSLGTKISLDPFFMCLLPITAGLERQVRISSLEGATCGPACIHTPTPEDSELSSFAGEKQGGSQNLSLLPLPAGAHSE